MEGSKELESASSSIHSKDTGQVDNLKAREDDIESQTGHNDSDTNAKEKTAKDRNIVDWDGPDDPANPMNWSTSRKVGAVGIVSLITLLSPLASTIIAPATADVLKTFNSTSETLGAFVTSVYLIGYAFGPLVIAPLSELYGRAIMYNICNTFFLIFSIACAVANSLGSLIAFRLLAGIASSCPVTLGAGTIADMVKMERRGMAMTLWLMGPLIGPTCGPLISGYLSQAKGWRWTFWLMAILGGAVWIASIFLIRESYAYVILKWKTQRLRKETGNQDLKSALDTGKTPEVLFKVSIVRPVKMLFLSPIVFLMSIYMAIVYATVYLMFTTFPRVFEGQYGFSSGSVGLAYLGIGIGAFIGLSFCGIVSDRLVKKLTKRNGGEARPEYRLPAMFIGVFVVPVGLFLYGWTAEFKVHWIVPIISEAFIGIGMFTIFMPVQTYLVDTYTVYAASVTAALTVVRSLLGALLPLAGNSMYNALGIGWGTSVLGFISVVFMPMPWIFWIYGQRIRESKFSKVSL